MDVHATHADVCNLRIAGLKRDFGHGENARLGAGPKGEGGGDEASDGDVVHLFADLGRDMCASDSICIGALVVTPPPILGVDSAHWDSVARVELGGAVPRAETARTEVAVSPVVGSVDGCNVGASGDSAAAKDWCCLRVEGGWLCLWYAEVWRGKETGDWKKGCSKNGFLTSTAVDEVLLVAWGKTKKLKNW